MSLQNETYSANEGAGNVTVCAEISDPADRSVSVAIFTVSDTAESELTYFGLWLS